MTWQPGDPLYDRNAPGAIGQTQPMFTLKQPFESARLGRDAARWTPKTGWRSVYGRRVLG